MSRFGKLTESLLTCVIFFFFFFNIRNHRNEKRAELCRGNAERSEIVTH